MNLSVELAGVTLKNPVMTASGTFGKWLSTRRSASNRNRWWYRRTSDVRISKKIKTGFNNRSGLSG